MTTLHDQIMNIPLGNGVSSGAGELVAYKTGHRDARHVAAEIAIASDARIEALEAEISEQARIIGMGAERELALMARISELDSALQKIAIWQSHSSDLSVDYGSNGVRDFYRLIAKQALKGQP